MTTESTSMAKKYSNDFSTSINTRAEISEFIASIGNFNVNPLSCGIFYYNPNTVLI